MFIGHFAVGFAAKRWAPRTSFALLLLAPILADVLWPALILLGVEHARLAPADTVFLVLHLDDYPWSHSLLMDVVWGVLLGLLAARGPDGRRAGIVVGMSVVSHWVLDWITHRPDMPLWPGGPEYGLMLWRSVAGTMIVETVMFVAGLALFLGTVRARRRAGRVALWSFVAVLSLAYYTQPLSPPPPDVIAVGVVGLVATGISILWAWWIERTHEPLAAM